MRGWMVAALLVATACSMGLHSPRIGAHELRCTPSRAVPALDLTAGTLLTAAGVALAAQSGGCEECVYVLVPTVGPGVAYLAASISGFHKVNACRRERDRRAVAEAAPAPEEPPFFCAGGVCRRTAAACAAAQGAACEGQAHASCLEMARAGTSWERCFATVAACTAQRAEKLGLADLEVGECNTR